MENTRLTLAVLFGMIALYSLLPRPTRFYPFYPLTGAVAAAGALMVVGLAILRITAVSVEVVLFLVFSAIAIVAGGLLVTLRNPVHGALAFALVVLSTCGLFLLQAAPFLMAATTIVYAGAIVVTFLFVIMLAQQSGPSDADQRSREPFLATFAGFILLGSLLYVLNLQYEPRVSMISRDNPDVKQKVPIEALLYPRLERIERALTKDKVTEIEETLGNEQFFEEFSRLAELAARTQRDQQAISAQIWNMQAHWDAWERENNVAAVKKALIDLERTSRLLLVERFGSMQPRSNRPLSTFSGTPANEPFHKVERDDLGFPKMKADTTAYLGRALFSDFLLAVELAGTLLLVAAIGTIAIASRRAEGLR